MEKKLHITLEETIALFDKKWELFPETVEHIEKCSECSSLMEKYSRIHVVLTSTNRVSSFPDMEKINRIAENSFSILHSAQAEEKESFVSSITKMFSTLLRPVAISAAAAAVIFAVYFGMNSKTEEIRTADKEGSTEKTESVKTFPAGLKKSGETMNLSIASIETLSDTKFDSIAENEVKMGKGKAKFDVVSGNDFRINVSDKFLVRVLGTSFILDYSEKNFSVKVINGLVEVIDSSDNSSLSLTADMEKVFAVETVTKKLEIASVNKVRLEKPVKTHKLNFTPEASFLFQGREALNSGNNGAALQLFLMEMEKGKEKDKALFESVKLYENQKQYKEIENLLKNSSEIMSSSKVYKEELMIKGCRAQKRSAGSTLSFCKEYLKVFPNGYRKNEIRELINE